MRTLMLVMFVVLAPFLALAQNGKAPKQTGRELVIVLLSDTMIREPLPLEVEIENSMKDAADGLAVRNEFKSRLVLSRRDYEGMLVTRVMPQCKIGTSLVDCLALSTVKRYVDLRVRGQQLIVDRYDFGADSKYSEERFIIDVDLSDKALRDRMMLNLIICHGYPDKFKDITLIENACGELDIYKPSTPSEYSTEAAPEPRVIVGPVATEPPPQAVPYKPAPADPTRKPIVDGRAPTRETKSVAASKTSPLKKFLWVAPAAFGLIPLVSLPLVIVGGAVIYGVVSSLVYSMNNDRAAKAGYASSSPYRTRIQNALWVDYIIAATLVIGSPLVVLGLTAATSAVGAGMGFKFIRPKE